MAIRSQTDALRGSLDLLVLQTLTWGPQHGYGITAAINAGSSHALQVDTGSLYPALHRLDRDGSVASEWKTSENKQRVKVYRLTAAGRRRLTEERSRWQRLLQAMSGVLDASKGGRPVSIWYATTPRA